MEPECKLEKKGLIKLIWSFKSLVKDIVDSNVLDLKNNEKYLSLKTYYKEVEDKLVDPDYFHCLLGESFDDKCNQIYDEDIDNES